MEMTKLSYTKRVTPMDVYNVLQNKGIQPSDITVEEDGDEIRIILPDSVVLTDSDLANLDNLMKITRRKQK
jgi:hypothetical protein